MDGFPLAGHPRQVMVWRAISLVDQWYRWGGDDPSGWDCSGLAIECGRTAGIYPRGSWDRSASALYVYHESRKEAIPPADWPSYTCKAGCLIFQSRDGCAATIYHVSVVVSASMIVEAGGGSRDVTSLEAAIARNAFIKPRPLVSRLNPTALFADPFKLPA